MSIICQHVYRLELRIRLLNCGLLLQRIKCIFYSGHACLKLNLVLISHLTGKCATQKKKYTIQVMLT